MNSLVAGDFSMGRNDCAINSLLFTPLVFRQLRWLIALSNYTTCILICTCGKQKPREGPNVSVENVTFVYSKCDKAEKFGERTILPLERNK